MGMKAKPGTFGPGILGQEQYEKELRKTTGGRNIFGPGILGEEPKEEKKPPEDQPFPDMSVNNLRDTLNGNPLYLGAALETELKREPVPRKTALRLFLEYVTEDQQELKDRIEKALE